MAATFIQKAVLAIYRQPLVSMMLQTSVGARLFIVVYDLYKSLHETPGNEALARCIPAGTWVIDVGANNGYFTERFSRWVTDGGHVIAVEPDDDNLELLRRRISARKLPNISICRAAAVEYCGSIRLQRNPERPDDHRVGDTGVPVSAVTIDSLVEEAGSPVVSLIKIDTQGSEPRVLAGAMKTLNRCRSNLFIEIDDHALRGGGTSALDLIDYLEGLGYRFFMLSRKGREISVKSGQILNVLKSEQRPYVDILCTPADTLDALKAESRR